MRVRGSRLLVAVALLAPVALAEPGATRRHDEVGENSIEGLVERLAAVGKASMPRFSPDATQVALISDLSGVPQVWMVPAGGGWPSQVTSAPDPARAVVWSPRGDSIAVSISPGGGMNGQIYLARPDGSGMRRLTDGGKETNWLGEWTADGRFLSMISNRRHPQIMDALLIAPDSGKINLLAELAAAGRIEGISRDGRRILISRQRNLGDGDLYLLQLPNRKETLLTPHQPPALFSGAISPDGATVYVRTDKDRDLTVFARIPIDSAGRAAPMELLAERPDGELYMFVLNHAGNEAVLHWTVAGRDELSYIALPSGQQRPGPALPAEIADNLTYSNDDRSLAATVLGSTSPSDVWVWESTGGSLRQLTMSPHPGVDLSRLVKPKLVQYRAHDGLVLSGWLYRPPGVNGRAPYVLSFHGGPEGQELPIFRPDYQALLLQGIGVFAPNVRGSGGFGKKFVNLDNGVLRFDAIRDIETSAEYLIAQGLAQPRHLGIMGSSYGGYMTMAGLTEYPDLFRAGVDLYGIVNFATFFAHTEPWMVTLKTIEYGDPVKQAALLARLSPIHKLDRIKAALMVQHGANDTNVPVKEAEQIVAAMNARGVPIEYLSFPDEGHGWTKTNNRIRSITSMVAFFRHHLLDTNARSMPRAAP